MYITYTDKMKQLQFYTSMDLTPLSFYMILSSMEVFLQIKLYVESHQFFTWPDINYLLQI